MKAYVKPELFVESYELSQHIATCGIDVQNAGETNCAALDDSFWPGLGGTKIFDSECADGGIDITKMDVYCYTSGTTEAGKLFNS